MSIATELTTLATTLQGVLDDSNTALSEKGAANAANLKGLAAAIAAIETGSGVEYASGSFKMSSRTNVSSSPKTVTGVGFKPTRVVIFTTGINVGPSTIVYDSGVNDGLYLDSDLANTSDMGSSEKPVITFQSNGFKIGGGSYTYLDNARKYYWIAIKEA